MGRHRSERKCSIDGCGRDHRQNGYCHLHMSRLRNGSDMYAPVPTVRTICSVAGCEAIHHAKGYCEGHYQRKVGKSSVLGDVHGDIRYSAAHLRVKAQWGSASQYSCVECGSQAREWAYDGTDPEQLFGHQTASEKSSKVFYSRYPEFYMPMCLSCHRTRDSRKAQDELLEYRTIRHLSGLGYEQIFSLIATHLAESRGVDSSLST